jgi:predicted nucleic acid-binding protein
MVCIDTNVVIDFLKGRKTVTNKIILGSSCVSSC